MIADVLGKIGFDWKVALANLVNFLIIYWLLRNIVFKKIGSAIRERREKIQAGLDDAQKAKTELMMAGHEKEKILTAGHMEAKSMLVEAESLKSEIVESAKVEAELASRAIKESAMKDIEALAEQHAVQVKARSVELIMSGLEKILKDEIDAKKVETMIHNTASSK
jgi:F-type H+-transporting ATPase subunit b